MASFIKSIPGVLVFIACLIAVFPKQAPAVQIDHLSACETLENWGSNVRLTREAREGDFAVYAEMPAGKAGFMQFNFAPTGMDLSRAYALSFWWRAEGSGLRNVMVKVRNHPLVGGMEAVYAVWNPDSDGALPQAWQRAVVVLAEPLYDDWGQEPNLTARYVTFRTETEAAADIRLFVDGVRVLPPTFTWTVGTPWPEAAPVARADFDGDGSVGFADFIVFAQAFGSRSGDDRYESRADLDGDGDIGFSDFVLFAQYFGQQEEAWRMPVTFRNLAPETLSVLLGSGGVSLMTAALPPGGEYTADFLLPASAVPFSQLAPLQSQQISVWTQVQGYPETRIERVIKMVKPIDLPSHPRLLFNPEGIDALKARIARHPWARARWERTVRKADDLLPTAVVLPPRGGNWWHWYASPTTGASLKTGKQIGDWQWTHTDPVSGEVFYGDPSVPSRDYDGCVISGIHSTWSQSIRDLGIAYQVTGDARYAGKAREILLAYADRYLQYPLHNTRGEAKIGGGRVGPQTLDEAVWAIPVCQGTDLIWDTLSESDHAVIAEKLLQPAAREVILPHKLGVHNIQCWKNSAVGLMGLLLGDEELVWEAVENPERGYHKQMADGVTPDGAWWEGAWGYHFYTLSALWGLTEGARNCGMDLYGDALKRMYDAPLVFAMPNLQLPAFNDSGEVELTGQASVYELAYARYENPAYLVLLAASDRQNDYALWFGAAETPVPPSRQWASTNYPNSGYAVLAQGEGANATWLCLKYGPHGGGHGHPDKLNFVLASRGEVIGTDPGTAKYGLPIQGGWYRTTLAHNTLVVDEVSQEQAEGRCLAFGRVAGVAYVVAEAGAIYPGVTFRRTAALIDTGLAVFVDQVQAGSARTLDLVYHQQGTWSVRPNGVTWAPPGKDGYRYLEDTTIMRTTDGAVCETVVPGVGPVKIVLADGTTTDVMMGTGIGKHTEDRVPAVIFRRRAAETVFGWCVALDGRRVRMQWLPVTDVSGAQVAAGTAAAFALTPDGDKTRVLLTNPDGASLRVALPDGAVWETGDVFGVR